MEIIEGAVCNEPRSRPQREINEQLAHGYQSIRGCVEENTGWTMLHRLDMSVDFYHYTGGFVEDVWPLYYQRPPNIALW